ncbi:MAG: pyruvate dehydrogenase (acetyl-transferring) E1 component subunit alpha [Chloroflexi bacterium]|nr:pyruvate dehydrogenase (acetyl-transferring) E1 component subunit alpha [Chloroflexota bacterium]
MATQTIPLNQNAEVNSDKLVEMFRQMLLIRRFEEASEEAYAHGQIGGFLHLYIGQEAVAVGAISVLQPQDHIITAYRDHGHAIARGLDTNALMAELFGKSTGVSHGKGGSMHLADVSKHFWGGHAIVGGHLPTAVGLALAVQYQHQDAVVLAFFGDGATNIGLFHESLNLAAVWHLPIIFLCENNLYGMGTAVSRASAAERMVDKACGYHIPAQQMDGMDVVAVRQTMDEVVSTVRSGSGPHFVEALTYRYRGHSMGDAQRYRTSHEVKEWEERDPINVFQHILIDQGILNDKQVGQIIREVNHEIEVAVKFAEESPEPDPEALYQHIYVED